MLVDMKEGEEGVRTEVWAEPPGLDWFGACCEAH